MNILDKKLAHVHKDMHQFKHGGYAYAYPKDYIDFSANINPLGMPEAAKQAYRDSIQYCEQYPDPFCADLTNALSAYEGIGADHIVCGNGAADLIHRIIAAKKPKKALILTPTFSEYERAFTAASCEVSYYPLRPENHFALNEEICKAICPPVGMVMLCNPNNPTGMVTSRDLMREILHKAESIGALLLVDECFIDFLPDAEQITMKPYADTHCIVLKAFTKLFAMPGIRLGYALCDPDTANLVRETGQPWPVSAVAQMCGTAALSDRQYVADTKEMIAKLRPKLADNLAASGFMVYPGLANFILFRSALFGLRDSLLVHKLLIRDCANFAGLDKGFFRVAVRTERENEILRGALQKVTGKGR